MRIAFICADSGIPVFGSKGAAVHVQEVLRALLRQGAEIVLFARRIEKPPEDLQPIKLVALDPLPSGDAVARAEAALAANAQLEQALRAEEPFDLVYERYSLWSFAGLAYAHRQGWPAVLEVNAPLIEEQKRYRELAAEEKAEAVLRSLLASATAVIAVSPGVKKWLTTFAPASAKRIHVVANGVDPQRFAPRLMANRVDNALTIGFVGSLKPWHGVENLLEAFALLQAQRPESWLLIVGDGPERERLQALTQRRAIGNVVFTGAVAPAAVPEWLGKMDIAVAPYPQLADFYFSPLKIYEYMAAQLPVVTTRVGHLAEVVNDKVTGMLVEPEDPAALCACLLQLADNPLLRQRLGEAGRRFVEQHHSWDGVAKEILRIAFSSGSVP
ncbi:glycosyltransferase family 4 protein [Kalamiella sp. sgz302252]|uniref:glycosyltransferase family 4 protein n=1 Tax=Pantoea sp. sgz302252 TaxID=3341827 RepID=UPI0036D3B530